MHARVYFACFQHLGIWREVSSMIELALEREVHNKDVYFITACRYMRYLALATTFSVHTYILPPWKHMLLWIHGKTNCHQVMNKEIIFEGESPEHQLKIKL